MKILKFKKTTKDRYKVYLDNGDIISLYENVIINNNLLITKEIDDDKLKNLIKENDDEYAYNMAINYISIRMRSEREIKEYLKRKQIDELLIDDIVKKLNKNGLLNDFNFSKAYVNDALLLTTKGPNKIKQDLYKLGVKTEIIDEVMSDIDKDILKEKLSNLVAKKLNIASNKGSSNTIKLKLVNYFYNLGYDKKMILDELSNYKISVDVEKLQKEYDKLYNKYKNKYDGEKLKYFILSKLYSKGYTNEDIIKLKEE